MVRCLKCKQIRYFNSISELRTHQWRVHVEQFDNLKIAAKDQERIARAEAAKKAKRLKTMKKMSKSRAAKMRAGYQKWRKAGGIPGRKGTISELQSPKELAIVPNGGQGKVLSALDILNKFKDQRELLDKMISLVGHMISNPE